MTIATPPLVWSTTILFSVTSLAALTAVPWYGITEGYSTAAWVCFAIVLALNGFSITGGYHRLWAHKTYEAHWSLRLWYALWGAMAIQNSILIWASGHRRHHRHVDDNDQDPYSARRGFWFSHIGWMLRDYPSGRQDLSNVADLKKDPIVMWQHRNYLAITWTMNLAVPIALGLIFGDLVGFFLLVGIFRLVVSHHVTFFINSLAHIWGAQPFSDQNTARDNWFIALLTYGEGYHNFHHRFQIDYRNGVRWYQFDPTKWFIKACSWLGLTRNLQRVSNIKIQRAIVAQQFKRARLKLATAPNCEMWRAQLEKEYDRFKAVLQEWRELQTQRYQEKARELASKWHYEKAVLANKLRELEYSLKMQRKRLTLMTEQFAL